MNLITRVARGPMSPSGSRRRWIQGIVAAAALAFGPVVHADRDPDDRGRAQHWVASWATSPATFFVYTAPVPPTFPPGAPTARAPATIQPDLAFPFPNANTARATHQTIVRS